LRRLLDVLTARQLQTSNLLNMGRPLTDRPILIFSSREDEINYGPVVSYLRAEGHRVVDIQFDQVLSGDQFFAIERANARCRLTCDDVSFDVDGVRAAWWRKPQWVRVQRDDRARAMSLELELERTHLAAASLVRAQVWLNSPDAIRHAESKLRQLCLAVIVGLRIPATVVTNDWSRVRSLAKSGSLVYKALRGSLSTSAGNEIVFSNRLDLQGIGELEKQGQPWPGVFQTFIPARREWRVTVVGQRLFPAAIYATGEATVDWRRHQLSDTVRFASEQLDPTTADACLAIVNALDLRYGAIDLIESEDGTIYFLEINANGQYGWLERQLGLPISEQIARELAAIAQEND
jgi:glutathione synthase/RimK-type ligase-like ATP-grasp enzyme